MLRALIVIRMFSGVAGFYQESSPFAVFDFSPY
jgi:hypothetical protein